MSVCTKYPGSFKVETEFCARRYQKATFNPDDFSLEPCRTCADGKEAFGIWKDSFKDKENGRGKQFSDRLIIRTKPYKCRFCNTPTSAENRICLKCQIEGRTAEEEGARNEERGIREEKRDHNKDSGQAGMTTCRGAVPAPSDRKEEIMPGVTSAKICIDCGREYAPTSNVQKRCEICKVKHNTEGRKNYDATHKDKKSQASRERVPRQQKADQLPQGKHRANGGGESEPETYTIAVDFSRFPKLHQRLMKMADDEIRKPGDQLLFMLKNTLVQLEERA